jgi:hypothetical protein
MPDTPFLRRPAKTTAARSSRSRSTRHRCCRCEDSSVQSLRRHQHYQIDARDYFEQVAFPDHGKRSPRQLYPLCVGADVSCRQTIALMAQARHEFDRTAARAGNDQVRFEVAMRTLARAEVIAPVRDKAFKRRRAGLSERAQPRLPVGRLPINRGLWRDRGKETLTRGQHS